MIRRVSIKRAAQLKDYAKLRKKFLEENPLCEVCKDANAIEIHHSAGRTGRLLNDETHFVAVCRSCHNWIHENIQQAREAGWIAQKGGWNRR